jgi:hypothetical protein
MQGKLNVLNGTGHTQLDYDTTCDTPEAKAVLDEVRTIITEALDRRSMIVAIAPDGTEERIKTADAGLDTVFDTASEIVVIPQIVGG